MMPDQNTVTMPTVSATAKPDSKPLIKPLDLDQSSSNEEPMSQSRKKSPLLLVIPVLVILMGLGSGYLLSMGGTSANTSSTKPENLPGGSAAIKTDSKKEEGINDPTHFPDIAEGVIEVNDGTVTNEGSHRLIRPGGADQTAYLTSSIVDLDKYVGKKVEIHGQTNTAQKAGWLLEVGYLKVLE